MRLTFLRYYCDLLSSMQRPPHIYSSCFCTCMITASSEFQNLLVISSRWVHRFLLADNFHNQTSSESHTHKYASAPLCTWCRFHQFVLNMKQFKRCSPASSHRGGLSNMIPHSLSLGLLLWTPRSSSSVQTSLHPPHFQLYTSDWSAPVSGCVHSLLQLIWCQQR